MRLPFDLLTQNYTKPQLFLCETDKTKICELNTISLNGTFKFNSYSELQFSIGRSYINVTTGETEINPFYDKIEALRLVYLDGFGYFEIQEPEIVSDGIKEVKNVTAYGLEYSLSQKYLEEMYVNTGDINSIEVIQGNGVALHPIPLYDPIDTKLSLMHIIMEKIYGWTVGHIDESLKTMTRTFEVSRASVYDFITQDICDKFNCFAIFDTIDNTINLYAEALITKFIGDGTSTSFILSTPYDALGSVTIGGYPTTEYVYNPTSGELTFTNAPENGAVIEVVDGSQNKWKTDVYVSFDNLAQEAQVNYSADDIKTVLTVKGADDLGIHEVNMGNAYIVDLSYYYSVEWMGKELYDAYTAYLQKCNESQLEYKLNEEDALEISNHIKYEEGRLSLQYTIANGITSTTVGTYYVRGGSDPNYYYTEVSLPEEFNSEVTYYSLNTCNLNENKVEKLYDAIVAYYLSDNEKNVEHIDDLEEDFSFMAVNTIELLSSSLSNATSLEDKDAAVYLFLDEMWDQVGRTPLLSQYRVQYMSRQEINEDEGFNHPENEHYMQYHATELFINSIDADVKERDDVIKQYSSEYTEIKDKNRKIADSILMDVFFENYYVNQGCSELEAKQKAMKLLVRISPFLREDEYVDDNFVETDSDTTEIRMKTKQALLECGKIELARLCSPKLAFSMDMANIFALKEFEPIIYQFQLGNLINVVLRTDYIKRARLLAVNINFDDFSDFSCEFGELTSLKTQSSIHADLLSAALIAGKSVASNASYWSKGADLATSTAQKIQQGLLDATTGIYSSDQGVIIDKQGIKLTKVIDAETGEVHPAQAWLRNNMILLTTDGWKTARTGLGEFTIGNRTFYGLLADAMLAGYIEGSDIVGGTINIGNGNFVVDINGVVTMRAIDNIEGYAKTDYVDSKYSTLEKTLDGFRTTVGNTYSTKEEITGFQNQLNDTNQNMSAISTRVSSAETNILQNADAIKSSATKTEVQELNTSLQGQINTTNTITASLAKRITTAETSITQNSDSITSLATRTTENENSLSGVVGRVSTAETKIEQNADSITSLAARTSTVEDKFGNYSTIEQMNSAITQSADSIKSTVSSTYATKTYVDGEVGAIETRVGSAETSISQNTSAIALRATKTEVTNNIATAIDNISVGGRNFVLNSGREAQKERVANNVFELYTLSEHIHDLTPGVYMVSLFAKCTEGTASIDAYFRSSVTSVGVMATPQTIGPNYAKYVYTLDNTNVNISEAIDLAIRYCGGSGKILIKNVKLETGNKVTDWTPAPEDLDNRISTTETAINQTNSNLELKASKTEVTQAINNINVGGRNLLKNSDTLTNWSKHSTASFGEDNGFTTASFSAVDELAWRYVDHKDIPIKYSEVRGKEVTFSFLAKTSRPNDYNASTTSGLSIVFSLRTASSNARTLYRVVSQYDVKLSSGWSKVSLTRTINDSFFTQGAGTIDDNTMFFMQIYNYSLYPMEIKMPKLEFGNIATDWSKADDDVVGKTEVVSAINLSPESVKIKSNKIALEGYTTINGNFAVDNSGNVSVKGDIHATNLDVDDNLYVIDAGSEWSGVLWSDGKKDATKDETYPYLIGSTSDKRISMYAGNSGLMVSDEGCQLACVGETSYAIVDKKSISLVFGDQNIIMNSNGTHVYGTNLNLNGTNVFFNGVRASSALFVGSASSCTFTLSNYDYIVVLASPASGYTPMSCVLPSTYTGTFQVADEANFTKFTMSSTGISRSNGTGLLQYVYGINVS